MTFHWFTKLAIIFFVAFAGLLAYVVMSDDSSSRSSIAAAPRNDEVQQQREAFIALLRANGIVRDITISTAGAPNVYVGPEFEALDFKTKENIASTIYAYHFNGTSAGFIRIRDVRTDKEIASYDSAFGFTLE